MDNGKINNMIKQIDYNDNQQIEYTEFIAATLDEKVLQDHDTLKGLFNQFDLANDGHIEREELIKTFSKFGRNITIKEVDAMLK